MAGMIGRRPLAAALLSATCLSLAAGCPPPAPVQRAASEEAVPLRDAMVRAELQRGLQRVRDPLPAVARPGVLRSSALSLGDLPRMEPRPVSSAPLHALTLDRGRPSVNGYLLRLEEGRTVQFADGPVAPSGPCPDWDPRGGLRWEAIALQGWTPDQLEFELYSGDAIGCKASAKRASRVRARALVPSLLYAFRTCQTDCSPTDPQALHVVGPGSRWLAHSAPELDAQAQPHSGLFSHASVPMGPGQSSSLVITVDFTTLHDFVARHRPLPEWETSERLLGASRFAQVQLDVVWLAGEAEPISQAYLLGDGPAVTQFLSSRGVGLP